MNRRLIALLAASAVLPCLAAGCGNPTVVNGNVTYEGKAVDDGSIVFLPENGGGPTCGGPIAAGQYRVACPTPGKKIVQIVGVKKVNFAKSSEEMERAAKEGIAKGDDTGIIDRTDVIPANALGNNTVVEVKPGPQTLDFHLKPPAR